MEFTSECIVKGCYSRYGPMKGNRRLFRFPKDVKRCKQWAHACGQMDLFKYKSIRREILYNSRFRVCSLHFEERMYAGSKRMRLHADAVPTLLLDSANNSFPLGSGSLAHSALHSVSQNINNDLLGAASPLKKFSSEHSFDFIEVKGEPMDEILEPVRIKEEIKCELPTESFEVNLDSAGDENMTSGGVHIKTDWNDECQHLTRDDDVNMTFDDIEIGKNKDILGAEDLVPKYGNRKTLSCEICKKPQSCHSSLLNHWPTHLVMKPFKCLVCYKQYLRKSDLAVHELVHLGYKSFKCGECNKPYVQHTSLVRHLNDHFRDRPFKCEICLETFTEERNLVDHQRTHLDKPFKCHFCFEEFSSKTNLMSHLILCSAKKLILARKRFTCNVCSKIYSTNESLRDHQRVHSGEKPFKCTLCSKNFAQKWNLTEHQRVHCERSRN